MGSGGNDPFSFFLHSIVIPDNPKMLVTVAAVGPMVTKTVRKEGLPL
jgi:hypothetical protein